MQISNNSIIYAAIVVAIIFTIALSSKDFLLLVKKTEKQEKQVTEKGKSLSKEEKLEYYYLQDSIEAQLKIICFHTEENITLNTIKENIAYHHPVKVQNLDFYVLLGYKTYPALQKLHYFQIVQENLKHSK